MSTPAPVPLRYIKGGSPRLALRPIASVPERHDRSWKGVAYRGDEAIVRRLAGRIHNNVCYRHADIVLTLLENHAIRAALPDRKDGREPAQFYVSYTTGLGTQHFEVGCYALQGQFRAIMGMPDDVAHGLVLSLVQAQLDGAGYGHAEAASTYTQAFVNGTLRKRKVRGGDRVKVWIEESSWEGRVHQGTDGLWYAGIVWVRDGAEIIVLNSQNGHRSQNEAHDEAMSMLSDKAPDQVWKRVAVL